jgi:hypothetical protein
MRYFPFIILVAFFLFSCDFSKSSESKKYLNDEILEKKEILPNNIFFKQFREVDCDKISNTEFILYGFIENFQYNKNSVDTIEYGYRVNEDYINKYISDKDDWEHEIIFYKFKTKLNDDIYLLVCLYNNDYFFSELLLTYNIEKDSIMDKVIIKKDSFAGGYSFEFKCDTIQLIKYDNTKENNEKVLNKFIVDPNGKIIWNDSNIKF